MGILNKTKKTLQLQNKPLLLFAANLLGFKLFKKMENQKFDLFGEPIIEDVFLRDKFIEPPFSVLDTKSGAWQKRKRAWKNLGIESHLGRDAECLPSQFGNSLNEDGLDNYGRKPMLGVSVFDPALCELIYRWYCPDKGTILDPFAGGSVRGIVANYLGYNYTGIDIRKEQIDSNKEQAIKILPLDRQPIYYIGDSNVVLEQLSGEYDLIFSCPPYHNLEVYSEIKEDLSTMDYGDFVNKYFEIIKKATSKLKRGGYACFVVSDIRDKRGFYRDFISHTKSAFINSGVLLYNEAILLQPLGTAMLRAGKIFNASKKLIKVHEHVLIFKKP